MKFRPPVPIPTLSEKDVVRFWQRVNKDGPIIRKGLGPCWIYLGYVRQPTLHGQFIIGRKSFLAHRVSYTLAFGAIPPLLIVRHKCDQGDCVNPKHLILGTRPDNIGDMISRDRLNAFGWRERIKNEAMARPFPNDRPWFRPRGLAFEERFWSKVRKSKAPDGCWLWTDAPNLKTGGNFHYGGRRGKTESARRISYRLAYGTIPPRMRVFVACKEQVCIRPSHLYLSDRSPVEVGSDGLRFWAKVNKNGPIVREELGPCWLWTGGIPPSGFGYGQFRLNHKSMNAHRAAWILTHGEPSENSDICHKCDNPPCVNPGHLFLGTRMDNVRDMWEKSRASEPPHRRGEKHPNSVFTESDVFQIRKLAIDGIPQLEIASRFGIGQGHVNNIITGRIWGHVHKDLIRKPNYRGESHKLAKLSEDNVREIRKLSKSGLPNGEIARRFSIDRTNVSAIIRRKTWKHIA